MIKNEPADVGDMSLIPGSGRSPGGGNGNLLQYSCLENHGQSSQAGYSPRVAKVGHDSHTHTHTHTHRVLQRLPLHSLCMYHMHYP